MLRCCFQQYKILIPCLIILLGGCGEWGTTTSTSLVVSGSYLLAFHSCDTATTDCSNPSNHLTYLAQSNDGATWTLFPNYTAYSGSVPDVIRRGNTLYIYNPGTVRKYDLTTGTLGSSTSVSIQKSDGSQESFVDPSPILDENGKITLFYLVSETIGSDPARCQSGESSCTKIFHSATEVDGSDGTSFTVDDGSRAEVTIDSSGSASDPDIFQDNEKFILYISRGSSVQALSSNTLKGSYANITGLQDGILINGSGGIPAGHYDTNTQQYWTYVHTNQGDVQVIRRAIHASLTSTLSEGDFSTVVSGTNEAALGSTFLVASPGFTINQ